jgi:UDP-N-acetylglucosamine--N-acetylmuramyl-(pentapeptide) pyrophosphoryl-undecaprenol N-acetylglucosamine transferase
MSHAAPTGDATPTGGAAPNSRDGRGLRVLLATGGTAGHIEPALAVADALTDLAPGTEILVMGSPRGLETTLVPARGYELVTVPAVPLPRKPTLDVVKLPWRLIGAVRAARRILLGRRIDVVVGFGGYASLPAYLAARRRIPIVVHEANARAGIANKIGARYADAIAAAVPNSGLARAVVTGNPVRRSIAELDRAALRGQAREHFGLDPQAPTVLVTGGSQGAQRINIAVRECAADFAAAGIGVLHHHGRKNTVAPVDQRPPYVLTPYIERMDLAYAAADLVVARSGAMTVAELSAVGLPAVYVPLPHGNGEQRLNAAQVLASGAAIAVDDADFHADAVRRTVIDLMTDDQRFSAMRAAAAVTVTTRADRVVAQMVLSAGKGT